jgi:serine/threonine protein kinase
LRYVSDFFLPSLLLTVFSSLFLNRWFCLNFLLGFNGTFYMRNLLPGLAQEPLSLQKLIDSNAGAAAGAAPATVHISSFHIPETDEFAPDVTVLHAPLATSLVRDEVNGSLHCKGVLVSPTTVQLGVSLQCFRRSGVIVDTISLKNEIKILRILSRKSAHIARILHSNCVNLHTTNYSLEKNANGTYMDMFGIVSETSDLGTLDMFTRHQFQNKMQMQQINQLKGVPPALVDVFSQYDLQNMAIQLVEGLSLCHDNNVRHRDIRPQNIIVVQSGDKYQTRQFSHGLVLKYANFVPITLLPLCSFSPTPAPMDTSAAAASSSATTATATASASTASEAADRWCAPEVDLETRKTGVRFQAESDVWSLGLTLYFLATGGQLPFDTFRQACDAAANADYRRVCLEKHGLQERAPMLYDLIERLVRPLHSRTELTVARCHPFLWSMEARKAMLTRFAHATTLRGSEVINNFITGIDKISPLYVFGSDGWVGPMWAPLQALLPAKYKTDFWWSGSYLLQAIQYQLQCPDLLVQSVYPHMSQLQATHAYVRQVTESDFPRLLILLFELGGIHGKWVWDGDEVMHAWN